MEKAPSIEEITTYITDYKNALREHPVIKGSSVKELAMMRGITVPMLEACEQVGADRDEIWALCKKFAQFSHAPVKLKDYERMAPYAQNQGIVDTVLKLLETFTPPESNSSLDLLSFDVIGYYYCIALISQSDYRLEDCKEKLASILQHSVDTKARYMDVLIRNINVLKVRRPYLENILENTK